MHRLSRLLSVGDAHPTQTDAHLPPTLPVTGDMDIGEAVEWGMDALELISSFSERGWVGWRQERHGRRWHAPPAPSPGRLSSR